MSESHEEVTVDEIKRKDGSKSKKDKKDKKDKGYMIFEEEDSAEELCENLTKTQSKPKKTKPFKFAKKEKKERSEKKKQDEKEKKPNKESKKEGKTKWKKKILPKSGEYAVSSEPDEQKAVFGAPLTLAVERNPSHDGILLPAVIRECIDYISEYGLACEGIYRVSGVKSKVTQLKELYNTGATVYLVDHEPNVVASLLKLFLRELPEPILTTKLVPKFEQASATKNVKQQVEQFLQLIQELPAANRTLLSWVIVHMTHVIEKEKFNKMSLQNVSIVLSPTMKISHRVLNVLFTYSNIFFRDTIIKKYVPPLKPATSRWALDLPECPSAIEEELKKQESLLNHMHEELMRVNDHRKEEELWEVQRIVTQLKRKLKHLRQMEQAPTKSDISLDKKQSFSSQKSWSHVPHGHHESSSKISLESSSADLSKVQDKLDRSSLSGDQTKLDAGVKLRSKEHLRGSEKKHHTPEAHSRKKMLHGEGSTKRHSSSASERSSRTDKADIPNKTSLDKGDNNLGIPHNKGIGEPIVEGKQVGGDKKEEDVAEPEEVINEVKQEDSERDLEDVKESNDVAPITPHTSPVEDSVIGEEANNDSKSKPDLDLEQGTSVDRRSSIEEQEVRPTKSHLVESADEQSQQLDTWSYKSIEDDASDSSDPYTDVAEEDGDGDDDDSDKKSSPQKRGDTDDNDYEVLGEEEESPSPKNLSRPLGIQGSLVAAEDSNFVESSEESSEVDEFADHAEMFDKLLEEYNCLMMEEEELLAIGDELRQKIETERNEIERLQQDISELHMMRHDDAFETSSSSSSLSSYSSGSFDDDVTTDELKELLLKHQQENAKLERDNAELCEKIHQERMACLEVKVQNRMIQQKQLHANIDLIDFE